MTVDIFPHILANVVDIQKDHLLLHTPVLNKISRLSSAIMFQDVIDCCLYIDYMYQWQNQHALPSMPGWILVPSDPWRWQEMLLCSVAWHCHQSYVQHYIANLTLVQCVIASHAEVWTCQFWWKIYLELTVTMAQVPEGTAVSTQGQHRVQYKEGRADQRRSFNL